MPPLAAVNLIWINFATPEPASNFIMAAFLFRCPNTGLKVQGWVAEAPPAASDETYEAVTCTACVQVHLVNPVTGRVLGSDDE